MGLSRIFGSREKNPDDYLVALDIGTEYIKALIAKLDGDRLEIIGVGRSKQRLSDMYAGAIADILGVVQNCESALVEAEEQAEVQPKKAVIGIAGELVKGTTNNIKYRRPQPDRSIDALEMELIIDKVQEKAYQKAQKQIAIETGNPDVEIKLVNSALVSIHIDGYKVANPIGFQGRDVLVQIYTAFAPMVHIGALEKVANELSLELLAVTAEPFAVSRSVLSSEADNNLTAILIDIGGGTTDIAVVNDGGVEGTKMFGLGGRSFTKMIASDLDVSYIDAEKLKLNLDNDKLKPEIKQQVEESVDRTLEVWVSGVELALSEFDAVDHLPNRILLCGGGASLIRLVDTLRHQNWHDDLSFTKKPTVQHIKPKDVLNIEDKTGLVNDHTFVTAMGLLRVGHDTILGSGNSESVIDRINKILRI